MSGLAGTGVLARLALRRDRIMLPAWVYVVTALVAGTAWTFKKVYSPAGRVQLLVSAGHNPALLFLYGRLYGTSVGALTAWRYGVWAAIFAAVMSIMLVIRHTRADEESAAYTVTARRDCGAGLLPDRPGARPVAACWAIRSAWPGGCSGAR